MTNSVFPELTRPWYKKKILWIILLFLTVIFLGGYILYSNINRLLTDALQKNFNSNIVSDVYELKFEDLKADILLGDIKVMNVVIKPREKPLQDYPYINSSFQLTTDKLILKKVKILKLLRNQILELDKIEINNPDVKLTLAGDIHVLFPFKDSTLTKTTNTAAIKKFVDSFYLRKFALIDANFHVTNSYEQREFNITNLNFAFNDLYISQNFGRDSLKCKSVELSIEAATGTLLKSGIRQVGLKDFKFNLENLDLQKSLDTVMFHFDDFSTGVNSLDIQTADSIFHIAVQSFRLSYKEKSIKLAGVKFEPNISESDMQKRHQYQNTQFSAVVGSLQIINLNFDSLIYRKKLFIDELLLDSVTVAIFKDKTKPVDLKRFPEYLGQQIGAISFPMQIKRVVVKNSEIVNRERKPDGNYAKVTVSKLNASVSNVTTLTTDQPLIINGEAVLENTARFKLQLSFDYINPRFTIDATIGKFNLNGLNALLRSYTPAKINSGIVDELSFSGTAYKSKATGTLKFLYHDLNVDLQLKEQAQWKSSLGAFAANTYLNSANPVSKDQPPHIVKYEAERDMNKGFINIVLKSLFAGLKETMIPSKENRKTHQEAKKERKNRDDKK